ncbi:MULTISPECIES: hypothetical protein [Bacillaceae]|uniref:Prephenate dehydratase n=1 Tax=Ectobacillus funiculus TaxID=137993 RepID=A0ABV5WI19_9BACI
MSVVSIQEKTNLGKRIKSIHTLGPTGTNCEKAAKLWFEREGINGEVILHKTLEEAIIQVKNTENSALLGCAVYPKLHNLVFANLAHIELVDSFIIPTYNMVLAARKETDMHQDCKLASHPAPVDLAYTFSDNILLVNSNSQAALDCASGNADACITTITAARKNNLVIIKDFGEVPMCFTLHAKGK